MDMMFSTCAVFTSLTPIPLQPIHHLASHDPAILRRLVPHRDNGAGAFVTRYAGKLRLEVARCHHHVCMAKGRHCNLDKQIMRPQISWSGYLVNLVRLVELICC
jgi:hypothetical protein